MNRRPPSAAFTLIEMLTVMAVIGILAGLILSVNGLVQRKAGTAKAETEIRAMSAGCENYKADNGTVPHSTTTDELDARKAKSSELPKSSLVLYRALSGDTNADGKLDSADGGFDIEGKPVSSPPNPLEAPRAYLSDFFKPERLSGDKNADGKITNVKAISDPFGNSYGYSTAGAKAEEDYREQLRTKPTATRPAAVGYNSTFDLWSTGGASSTSGASASDTAKWVKNW